MNLTWRKARRALWGLASAPLIAAVLACTSGEPPVLFTSDRDGNKDIFAVRVSDGIETNLTQSAADESVPIVSPNRKLVAFLSVLPDPQGGLALDVMDVNGEARRRIAAAPGVHYGHRWSPDSSRLAYVHKSAEGISLHFNNVEGTQPMPLSSMNGSDVGGWSPDGSTVSFAVTEGPDQGIYVRNPDGVNEFRLTQTPDSAPVWSPDAQKLAFISTRDGNPEIYVMNADGSGQKRLTANESPEYAVSWSPNSKSLLFVSEQDGNPEIYVMQADGTDLVRLTHNEVSDIQPVWSPNGKRIAFVSYLDGDAEIFVMSADGREQVRLTNNQADDTDPSW